MPQQEIILHSPSIKPTTFWFSGGFMGFYFYFSEGYALKIKIFLFLRRRLPENKKIKDSCGPGRKKRRKCGRKKMKGAEAEPQCRQGAVILKR